MYRAGLESMLGLRRRGDTFAFAIDPCVPASWPGYEIVWRVGQGTRYEITVMNPDRHCRGVATAVLDDATANAAAIPLVDDGLVHRVRIVMGSAS
jgi:cyclic beta-1,2-glucan glucanotransferase